MFFYGIHIEKVLISKEFILIKSSVRELQKRYRE